MTRLKSLLGSLLLKSLQRAIALLALAGVGFLALAFYALELPIWWARYALAAVLIVAALLCFLAAMSIWFAERFDENHGH